MLLRGRFPYNLYIFGFGSTFSLNRRAALQFQSSGDEVAVLGSPSLIVLMVSVDVE